MTRAGMLKALAYAALFLLVALYPFGAEGDPHAEERFCRTIFGLVLAMGFVVAFLGLMNWASWNGKILWFFVPLDWEGPHLAFALRATGPFVNPDHFANYLAMILPLALVAALLRIDLVPRASASPVRMASMAIAFVVLCAIVLSLSRGGWISTAIQRGRAGRDVFRPARAVGAPPSHAMPTSARYAGSLWRRAECLFSR